VIQYEANYQNQRIFMKSQKNITKNERETQQLGHKLGKQLQLGDVVFLIGDLGSGKTTFTKGIAKGLGYQDYRKIKSPTFTLVHEIPTAIPLLHFDLYRLGQADELWEMGFEDYLDRGIVVIEWADKFIEDLPTQHIRVDFSHRSIEKRAVTITIPKKVSKCV